MSDIRAKTVSKTLYGRTPSSGVIGNRSPIRWNPVFNMPPNIATDFMSWLQWKNNRMAQFQAHCPRDRGTTYYFANSGDDSLGDGSQGNPWATRGKAKTIVAATTGNVRCRFKRGDIFRENLDWNCSINNVTVDDYGTGALPIITQATQQYLSAGWSLSVGNLYVRAETNDIAWVLIQSDRLGETRGQTLSWQDSLAHVTSVSNSFWWDSSLNLLYVNLGGQNPNTFNMEGIVSNGNNGIAFSGDGCRAQNIVFYGFGLNRTSAATQCQGCTSYGNGTNANYFNYCEAYYSGTHVMAHYANVSGGHAMFNNCTVGYGRLDGSLSMSAFNFYAAAGGHECWVLNSTIKYGGLPSYEWSFATLKKAGQAFYGHTSSGNAALCVAYMCTVTASIQPCSMIGSFNNVPTTSAVITACRSYVVTVTRPTSGYTAPDSILITSDTVYYAVQDYYQMVDGGIAALAGGTPPSNFWLINSYLECNATAFTGGNLGLTNFSGGSLDIKMYIWHSQIKWKNVINTTSLSVDIFTCFNSNALPDAAANMRNSTLINSIYSHNQSTSGYYLGMYNDATHLINNAYYNVTQSSNTVRGFNNDAGKQTPASEPVLNASQSAYLLHGSTSLMLPFDMNNKVRSVSPPDIGPTDYSSIGPNLIDLQPDN